MIRNAIFACLTTSLKCLTAHYPPTSPPLFHLPPRNFAFFFSFWTLDIPESCFFQRVVFCLWSLRYNNLQRIEKRKRKRKVFEWCKEWWALIPKERITVMITRSRYCWLVILVLARAAFFSVSSPTWFMTCPPPLVLIPSLPLHSRQHEFLCVSDWNSRHSHVKKTLLMNFSETLKFCLCKL